jgi:transposase
MHTLGMCLTMLVGMRPSGSARHGTGEAMTSSDALLRAGQAYRHIARALGAPLSSVVRWHRAYRRAPRTGLRARPIPGGRPRLTNAQQKRLRQLLLRGARAAGNSTELWTLKRIATLIATQFGVHYSPVGVWKLLRRGLGWSWQKPERRALQR